jgi:hypothetical protein
LKPPGNCGSNRFSDIAGELVARGQAQVHLQGVPVLHDAAADRARGDFRGRVPATDVPVNKFFFANTFQISPFHRDWRSRQMWLSVLCQEHNTDIDYQC